MKFSLEHIIGELLYRYERVGLPGFGVFEKKRSPALFSSRRSLFYPPSAKINFRDEGAQDMQVLKRHVSLTENLTESEAEKIITEQIKVWNDELSRTGRLFLKGLGEIRLVNHHKVFFPDFKNGIPYEHFGLSSLNTDNPIRLNMHSAEKKKPLKKDVSTPVEKKPVLSIEDIINSQPTRKRGVSWGWMKYAAVTVLGLAMMWGVYKSYKHYYFQKHEPVHVQQASFVIPEVLPAVEWNYPTDSDKPSVESAKFYIIAGAFRNQSNAEKMLRRLKQMGFKNPVLAGVNKRGLHLVAYEGFSSLTDAQKKLSYIKKHYNPQAWILNE